MTELQRFRQAPVSVAEVKSGLFLPYSKEKKEYIEKEIIVKNEFYEVAIFGYKLNQIHRDILDIALYYGDSSLETKTYDRRPLRLFSLYEIQSFLNYKSKNQNKWLEEKFEELKRTNIKIKLNGGSWIMFNIVDVAKYSEKQNKYALIISDLFMSFFESQISVGYKHYLPQILKLKNAQSKALARFIISHSNSFNISLDKAMEHIGIKKSNMTTQVWNWNKRKILEDIEELEKLNISFIKQSNDKRKKDYTISYKMLENVKIYHPKKTIN